MIKLINISNLIIQNERELHHVIKILMAVTFQNLVHMFVKDWRDKEALNNYIAQIEWLKKGIQKDHQ